MANKKSIGNEHLEGLGNCLKAFNENKINKGNVWKMSLIDDFKALVDNHHRNLSSFQLIGTSLEAASKIYGMRVDSVHADVMQMSSSLIRQNIAENSNHSVASEVNTITDQSNEVEMQRPVGIKKRVSRNVNTVTRNRDAINAKLELFAETDAIFAKQSSTNNFSSKKLSQHVLPTTDSAFQLHTNYKIWSSEDAQINDPDTLDVLDKPTYELPEMNWIPSVRDVLRPQITGYVIANTPADCGYEQVAPVDNTIDISNYQSFMDIQFDINAAVESVVDDDVEIVSQHSRQITDGKRNTIDNMRPVSAVHLEYSYRTLADEFHWAGPSYWKLKKIKTHNVAENLTGVRKKKAIKDKNRPIHFKENVDDSVFMATNSRSVTKLRKVNISKRWDVRKLKLPTDHKLERNRFSFLSLAPAISLPVVTNESDIGSNEGNYVDLIDDADMLELHNSFGDVAMPDHGVDGEDGNYVGSIDDVDMPEFPESILDIAEPDDGIDGADGVRQSNPNYAKNSKNIDMNELTRCSLEIINKDLENTSAGCSSFGHVYQELPQKLSQNMKEALTPSVAFYAILHAANENQLHLVKEDEKNDFSIKRME